jgi:hypothetical protein
MKAENRICSPAVPFTEATLPASVLMSYDCPHAAGNIAAAASVRKHRITRPFFMAFLPFTCPVPSWINLPIDQLGTIFQT